MLSSKKALAINITASVVSYLVSLLISFILNPYIINNLGKEAYSYFSIANNFVSYMSIISIALNSMASRFITIEESKGNRDEARRFFSSVFWGNIVLILILLLPMGMIVIKADIFLNISPFLVDTVKVLFALVFLNMLIGLITSVFSTSTYVKNKLYLNSLGEIFFGIARGVLLFLMYFTLKPSILYMGIAGVILGIGKLLYFILISKKIYPEFTVSPIYCDIHHIKALLSSGIWRSLDSLGGLLLFSTDLLVANMLISESAGGSLSIVHMFPSLLQGILSAVTSVFLPQETWLYGRGEIDRLVNRVKFSQKICGASVSIPICGIIILGRQFFDLWVPGNDSDLLQMLSVLCIGYMPFFITAWPVANLNVIMNRNKIPAYINIAGGITNVLSMVIGIKVFDLGLWIVPCTSLVIEMFITFFFYPFYPCDKLNISRTTFIGPVVKCIVECLVVSIVGSFVLRSFQFTNWMSFLIVVVWIALILAGLNVFIWLNKQERVYLISVMQGKMRRKK